MFIGWYDVHSLILLSYFSYFNLTKLQSKYRPQIYLPFMNSLLSKNLKTVYICWFLISDNIIFLLPRSKDNIWFYFVYKSTTGQNGAVGQISMFWAKKQEKTSEKEPNKMEISNLPDREFKVMVINTLIKLREEWMSLVRASRKF